MRIEASAMVRMKLYWSRSMIAAPRPMLASRKLNSPIWLVSRPAFEARTGPTSVSRNPAVEMIALPPTRTRTTMRDLERVLHQDLRLEEHPQGDEEERREDVPQRDDLGQHMRVEVRFGDDEAGEEGAQREREPRRVGGVGRAQRDDHDRQQEELPRAVAGDEREDARDQPRADDDYRHQRDRRHGERSSQCHQQAVGVRFQHRQQRKQGHHADVLQDAESERRAGVRAGRLATAQRDLDDHDRATRHERQPEQGGGVDLPAKPEADEEPEQDREGHLERAGRQGDPPHGGELVERELHAEGEHQERHPEVRHQLDPFRVRDESRRLRAERDPGEDVANQDRHPEPSRDHSADQRDPEREHEVDDEADVFHGVRPPLMDPARPSVAKGEGGASYLGELPMRSCGCCSCKCTLKTPATGGVFGPG